MTGGFFVLKKIIAGLLVAATVTAYAGTAAWLVPIGIEASYEGKKLYQNDTVKKEDIEVNKVSLLGRKTKVSAFNMESTAVNTTSQEISIQAGNKNTDLKVNVVPFKKYRWRYAGDIYAGDEFNKSYLTGAAVFQDKTEEPLKSFTLDKAPVVFAGGTNIISVTSDFGSDEVSLTAVPVVGIRMEKKGIIYEGKNKKDDFSFTLVYGDGTKKTIASNLVSTGKIKLKKGENSIAVTYNNKTYTVKIKAKKMPAAIKARSKFKEEAASADYKIEDETFFSTVKKKHTNTGTYLLTHIVVNNPDQVQGGLSYDSFGGEREQLSGFAVRNNAVIVTNGSYFSQETGQPACGNIFIKNGKIEKDGVTNENEICLNADEKFFSPASRIAASDLLSQGVREIWGTADPLLIQDGQKVDLASQPTINGKYYPRTAIGMAAPGEYYIITAGESGYSGGLSFLELQNIFSDLGCTFARSLDGGGSSSLVFNRQLLNNQAAGNERPVVDFLYFLK